MTGNKHDRERQQKDRKAEKRAAKLARKQLREQQVEATLQWLATMKPKSRRRELISRWRLVPILKVRVL